MKGNEIFDKRPGCLPDLAHSQLSTGAGSYRMECVDHSAAFAFFVDKCSSIAGKPENASQTAPDLRGWVRAADSVSDIRERIGDMDDWADSQIFHGEYGGLAAQSGDSYRSGGHCLLEWNHPGVRHVRPDWTEMAGDRDFMRLAAGVESACIMEDYRDCL